MSSGGEQAGAGGWVTTVNITSESDEAGRSKGSVSENALLEGPSESG